MPELTVHDFAIGQRVRIIDESHGWGRAHAGDEGTIVRVDTHLNRIEVDLRPLRDHTGWVGYPRCFEPVTIDNSKRECSHCGATGDTGYRRIHGDWYCSDCHDTCPDCSGPFLSDDDDNGMNLGGDTVCPACADNYTVCAHCDNTTIHTSRMRDSDGRRAYEYSSRYYCSDCFYDIFFICPDCGDTIRHDDSYYDDDAEEELCSSCYHDRETERQTRYIRAYNYKPSPQFHSSENENPRYYMGVEVEVNIDKEHAESIHEFSDNEEYFYLKEDGSINGFEVVSHPMTLAYHRDVFNWGDVFSALTRNGGRSHDTSCCGLHVHISRSAFTDSELSRFVAFININNDWFSTFARRNSDQWAKYKAYNGKAKSDFKQRERYEAVNLNNRNTVELRIFKGTLNIGTFYATLELCEALIHFIQTVSIAAIVQKPAVILDKFKAYIRDSSFAHLKAYTTRKNLI